MRPAGARSNNRLQKNILGIIMSGASCVVGRYGRWVRFIAYWERNKQISTISGLVLAGMSEGVDRCLGHHLLLC